VRSRPPPAGITSARVRRLYDYWESRRAGREALSRADLDPADIKPILPYILLGEFLSSPFDVRYRLVGTAVVEAYGNDFMGRNLRSLNVTTGLDQWLAHYARLASEKQPLYGRYRGVIGADLIRFVEYGVFPVSSRGDIVDQFIELEDWSETWGISFASMANSVWSFEPL